MGQVAQPLCILIAIERQNLIDRIAFIHIERRGITTKKALFDTEIPAMLFVEFGNNGAVSPRFNLFWEEGMICPYKRPSLRIIDELLQLHHGHSTIFFENVVRNIDGSSFYRRCHIAILSSPI